MSTLPLEVHEVLEEEYRAMYDAEPEVVGYDAFEVLEEQGGWARKILASCGIALSAGEGDADIQATLKSLIDATADGGSCPESVVKLASSPAISASGLTLLANYESYFEEDETADEAAK